MLGFNPGTQPVAMKEWVTPLDPSIYAQGIANQAKKTEEQSAQDSELYNSFMNIQAMSPQDNEWLQTLQQGFEKELAGLTMSNLKNPQTKAQLAQIQNKYTNLLLESGIPQRTSSYKQELAAKKEAESKGDKFTSPLLLQVEKYIQDGNFYKDERFNKSGWITPNEAKLMKSAKELVEKKKGWKENPNGTREEYEYYDPADLKMALTQVYKSDPNYEKELGFQFEQETKNINWDDYSKEENATIVQEARNNMLLAESLYNSTKDEAVRQKALEKYTEAQKTYSLYSDAYNNPSSPEEVRQNYYNDFKNKKLQMSISAMDAEQRKPITMNEIKKAQMDLSNDLYKMRETELFKLETDSGLSRKNYTSEADFIKDAATIVQQNKQTNAKLANPNYKVTASDAILDWTDKEWTSYVFQNNSGKIKIADNNNAKDKLLQLIQTNPEDFQDIPQDILNNLDASHIEVTKDGIQIDPDQYDPRGDVYNINSGRLVETKNKMIKNSSGGTPNKPNEIGLTLGYFQFGNDTVQAYQGNSMADTVNLKPGDKIVINGKLYEK